MQLVIDIPESILNTIQADEMISREQLAVLQMHILNGTPLPKGHGRLIDADSLIKTIEKKAKRLRNVDTINGLCGAVALIFDEQTIIEADDAESE